jgi:hypothetical protein
VKTALIFGGSGAAGQSAISALRQRYNKDIFIWGTTSKEIPVVGVDQTILGCDVTKEDFEDKIMSQLNQQIDYFIFTPARGNLGFPVAETTEDDLKDALKFSFNPMVSLERAISPVLTISYSAYYYLPHLLDFYGSMGFVKLKQEIWTLENPQKRKIIRAGSFYSQSVRGISLLLQRLAKQGKSESLAEMLKEQKQGGKKFDAFFLDYVAGKENAILCGNFPGIEYRMTAPEDLSWALTEVLNGEKDPIISIMGNWRWTEDKLPDMPDFYNRVL